MASASAVSLPETDSMSHSALVSSIEDADKSRTLIRSAYRADNLDA